jgi:protein gp88
MLDELSHKRFIDAWVRIHDSGDFHSRAYLSAWLEIMRARQRTRFYAYTKEGVYSYGGTQDSTLDPAVDRVADVFPDEQSIAAAGWHSQEESDLLAVLGPTPVGIPANNIAHFKCPSSRAALEPLASRCRCRPCRPPHRRPVNRSARC